MAAEFLGFTDVHHVRQPEDSELCFAAIVSAMTGAELDESHAVLRAAGLSEADGTTAPMGEERLVVAGSSLEITPFQSPFDGVEDVEGVLALIDEQFVAGRAVALLHKKNASPEDGRHHWTLLTGSTEQDGEMGAIHAIDPLSEHATYLGRHMIKGMIGQSLDYAGVYAYAMDTAPADGKEASVDSA